MAASAVIVARCRKDSLSPDLDTFANFGISILCLAGVKNILSTMDLLHEDFLVVRHNMISG